MTYFKPSAYHLTACCSLPYLYQANGSLPAACDCAYGPIRLGLPRFTHGVVRHDAASLSAETLALIDAHAQVRKVVLA